MADGVRGDWHQLPRGRHGLTRGAVVQHQRQRLIRAVPDAVHEKGYHALTVEDITTRAGVSRRTFYENFRDKEDCFVTSYSQHAEELTATVVAAGSAGVDSEERTVFALAALLRYFAARPAVAHMGVIDVMAAGARALAERDQTLLGLTSLIGENALMAVPGPTPGLLPRLIAGAILRLVYDTVLAGKADELEELIPLSSYMMLVPRHGPRAAAATAGLLTSDRTHR